MKSPLEKVPKGCEGLSCSAQKEETSRRADHLSCIVRGPFVPSLRGTLLGWVVVTTAKSETVTFKHFGVKITLEPEEDLLYPLSDLGGSENQFRFVPVLGAQINIYHLL